MRRFEYNMTKIGILSNEGLAEHLDALGSKGWQMIAIYNNNIFFMREMLEEHQESLPFGLDANVSRLADDAASPYYGWGGPMIRAIGPSGCGKSQILRILATMLDNIGIEYEYSATKEHVIQIRDTGPQIANRLQGIEVAKPKAGPAEGVFDYTYFMSPEHTWIKADKYNVLVLINICIHADVWFNYYPNTNNPSFPWLIVKSGMKDRLVNHCYRFAMSVDVIPGQHMTEDKL